MAVPDTIHSYLKSKAVRYEVVPHPHTASSLQSAISAHVPPARFAKGLLLKDAQGYFLAVIPASLRIDLHAVEDACGRRGEFASEEELGRVFTDCDVGAVPAFGEAYGLETVIDTRLRGDDDVYVEAGDHEDVIRLSSKAYQELLEDAVSASISKLEE